VNLWLAFRPALRGAMAGGLVALLFLLGMSFARSAQPEGVSFVGPSVYLREPGLDGQTIDLEDYRGQLVLLEFWASWSPVCRGEVAHLRAVWNRCRNRGLQIIGISLDEDIQEVRSFLRAEEVDWPQVFYPEPERRGQHNPVVQQFHAWTLPSNVLIDAEGRIIARDLRGPELDQAIEIALEQLAIRLAVKDRLLNGTSFLLAGLLIGSLVGTALSFWGRRQEKNAAPGNVLDSAAVAA